MADLDEAALANLKGNVDVKVRRVLDATNLARFLSWVVGGLAIGLIYVTAWVVGMQRDVQAFKEYGRENRQYIRDLWSNCFHQPLPPPKEPKE